MKTGTKYPLLITVLFFIVSLYGVSCHELWLDEAHHWLMARDSRSIGELMQISRPDGHPMIWSLLLYAVAKLTHDPFGMQLLHVTIASATVYVFLRNSPFPWLFRILFIFGYFMLFEYNLISRNYILGVFFLMAAMAFFGNRRRQFLVICLMLALAMNVHLLFAVISLALFAVLLYEHYSEKRLLERQIITGSLVFGIGFLFLGLQMARTDSGWFFNQIGGVSLAERIPKGFIALFKGLVALPDFRTLHFWNTNLLVEMSRPMSAVLGLMAYFIPLALFSKNRKTLFFVYLGLVLMQVFFFVTQRPATRFHGIAYLIFIVALWMEHHYANDSNKLHALMVKTKIVLLKKPFVYGVLLIHFFSGITAYAMDVRYSFMDGKNVVDLIDRESLLDQPIICLTCEGTLLCPYTEEKAYFLAHGKLQSYCDWNSIFYLNLNQEKAEHLAAGYMAGHRHAVYASFLPLGNPENYDWQKLNDSVQFRLLGKFEDESIVKSRYYVYDLIKNE